jgi:catechol 2,3-dioxygenase-like lactoylglutathione lyase family enzyme
MMLLLDHFTVRTKRPAETVRFFTEVVGLTEGWRPGFRFPGHWLYAGEKPVVHIVTVADDNRQLEAYLGAKGGGENGTGAIDHLAFRCQGLAETQARLIEHGYKFRERLVPALNERQLFVEEPNGLSVELVFSASENAEVRGETMPELPIA